MPGLCPRRSALPVPSTRLKRSDPLRCHRATEGGPKDPHAAFEWDFRAVQTNHWASEHTMSGTHRIMEWIILDGTLKSISFNPLLVATHQIRLHGILSKLVWGTSLDREP